MPKTKKVMVARVIYNSHWEFVKGGTRVGFVTKNPLIQGLSTSVALIAEIEKFDKHVESLSCSPDWKCQIEAEKLLDKRGEVLAEKATGMFRGIDASDIGEVQVVEIPQSHEFIILPGWDGNEVLIHWDPKDPKGTMRVNLDTPPGYK